MARRDDDAGSPEGKRETMAVAIPGAFLANVSQIRPKEEPPFKAWRLPTNHLVDLRDVTRGVEESNVGVCCKYLIDHTLASGNQDIDEDGYIHHLDSIERFCDTYGVWKHPTITTWRKRIARCRRALALMHSVGDHKHVSILYIVYGHLDPLVRAFPQRARDILGELSPLARYTDVVEVRRQEMARIEAAERAAKKVAPAPTKDIPSHWRGTNDEISEFDERQQSGEEITRVAIRHGVHASMGEAVVDLMKHRDLYEYSLRAISSADVLREQFETPQLREFGETKEQFQERKDVAEMRRDAFLGLVKNDAEKMLTIASKKYHASWLSSGGR